MNTRVKKLRGFRIPAYYTGTISGKGISSYRMCALAECEEFRSTRSDLRSAGCAKCLFFAVNENLFKIWFENMYKGSAK